MRIIAGTKRGKKLQCCTGKDIRPTSDRAREALFSSLFSQMGTFAGLRVLDLFSGTGALGLEALSRGAGSAVFVEKAASSVSLLRSNIAHCGFTANSQLVQRDAVQFLQSTTESAFDLIFLDPPYGKNLIKPCLQSIVDSQLLSADGMLCAEAGATDDVPLQVGSLNCIRDRQYARSRLYFFEHEAQEE